jgi:tRNA-2-methylthio-N6-dimethylallyladenosine synthase
MNSVKKFCIHTFGCQMNENDSEKLSGMLTSMGYTEIDEYGDADIVIFNTCCIRQSAEEKVYGHLGQLNVLKRENPDMIIVLCGCMPQQPSVVEIIKKKYKHVDIIFGTHNLHEFPTMLADVEKNRNKIVEIKSEAGEVAEGIPVNHKDSVKAWVSVMFGCNNFCSYCVVPYVRGRERSRRPEDICEEVKALAEDGFKEITLLGQNVNSYGKEFGVSFADILITLNRIDGIERIRFMTSHPKDLSDDLIYAIRDCDKVVESIHLPFQAGSNDVLDRMNRKYTREYYLNLIEKVKNIVPDISFSTDIIVGFPGETEEDFENTLDLVRQVRFGLAYTFLYSPRIGTKAAEYENQIPDNIKKDRFNRLLELQNSISLELNEAMIGEVVEVLVEGMSKNNDSVFTGRTRDNKIVNFTGETEKGKIVNVKITSAHTWSLNGIII